MEKIELTKEEVNAILNALGDLPHRMSSGLIKFFEMKLHPKKEEVVPGKGE